MLDIVPGRTRAAVQQWFSACDPAWRDAITTALLDPFGGYATALTHSLPQAARVLYAFHVVRLGQACVDEVRRRVQQQTRGRRGHAEDPLSRARRDLRRGLAHITDRQWARLELALIVGDPSGQLTDTWMAAQELQLLYARSHDLAEAKRRLWRILDHCAPSTVPKLHRLARTLGTWWDELLALRGTATGRRGVSNGPTEATNALIKKTKRVGHGFGNLTTTDCGCCSPSA